MRYSLISGVALFLGVASAASTTAAADSAEASAAIAAYPSCAQSCLISAVGQTSCSVTDKLCQCTTGLDKITSASTSCLLQSSCSAADLTTVQSVAASQCAAAIASGSGTAAASAASSAINSALSSAKSGAASSTASTTKSGSSTSSASGTGSASASASTAASTGAAGIMRVESAMVGLGLLAVFAL